MSINTITSNPIVLQELKLAIGGGGGSGISTLQNTDGNVSVDVSGSNGTINLEPNISTDNLNLKQQLQLNGNPGTSGQVLMSGGIAGNPSWSPPTKFEFFTNQQTVNIPDATQLTYAGQTFTGLTIGKEYLVLMLGTFNSKGTTPPTTTTTLVSYSALQGGTTQITTSETSFNNSTLTKIAHSYGVRFTATATSELIQPVIFITGTPQVNTISTDTNDYCNMVLMGPV
jgi:hypothetical protein